MDDIQAPQTNTLIPKYAHLEYQVLHDLRISIAEYFLLDMIFRLSGNGRYFANKKLENIAWDMCITKRGVTEMRNRLVERGLLIKGTGNRLRTSEKVNKVYFLDESDLRKRTLSSQKQQKVHPKATKSVAKTPVENNKRLTLDNRGIKNRGSGYQKALSVAALLKQRAK
jgi:hypothetical protein